MHIDFRAIAQKRSLRVGFLVTGIAVMLLTGLALDDRNIAATYADYPELNDMTVGFLSGTYQRATRVDAVIQHDTAYVEELYERSDKKESLLASTLYFINSDFYNTRVNAYGAAIQKSTINMPADQLANVRVEMLRAYAVGADKFLSGLNGQTVYHQLYADKVALLKTALKNYSQTARVAATKLAAHPADAEEVFTNASDKLAEELANIEKYGNFIMSYPQGAGVDMPPLVVTSMKKAVSDVETLQSADAAQLYTEVSMKVAIARALMPPSYDDTNYRIKADSIRVLLGDIRAEYTGAKLATDTHQKVGAALEAANLTMTLYDDAARKDDYSGGFIRRVQALILVPGSSIDNPADAYRPVLAKLSKIEPPVYVQAEYKQIIDGYAAAISAFDKSAQLKKQYDAAVAKSEQTEYKSLDDIFSASAARSKILKESSTARNKGYDEIAAAKESFIAIGSKVDDTLALNQSLAAQLDSIIAALMQ
ncbi:hypothetical protein KDA14_02510 [Candidatus Saccharibacteria bacterium]|nr:hypothetical protein [Candidatus Saccharibacteria bacterium]